MSIHIQQATKTINSQKVQGKKVSSSSVATKRNNTNSILHMLEPYCALNKVYNEKKTRAN